jgi:Calx-beta domain-containing protein
MSAPARRVIFFALVVGLLTLGLVVVPEAEAVNGALSVDSPTAVTEPQGSRKVVFTISLERDAGNDDTVRVDYSATPGTATAYQDFIPDVDGTAVFDDSETTQTVSIDVLGDSLDEEDETFTLVLSNAQASDGPDPDSNPEGTATIAAGIGTATILDDDGPPRVSIGGATVEEGDAGDVTARFSVALSSPSARPVSVTWATADGTATAGQDYEPDGGSLSFPPGEVSQVVRVTVAGDTLDELDEEHFMVGLSEPVNVDLGPASTGTGRILDDDGPPGLSVSDASGAEGGQADFTVSLSKESGRPVTVSAVTTGPGNATPNLDYGATSALIRFEPGEKSKTFSVPMRTDRIDEGEETFQVVISGAEAAAIDNAAGTGRIADTNPGPELSIGDVRVPEGDAASTLAFEVTLSQTPSQLVTVTYAASDGTARTVEDYAVNAGTLTFLPGTTTLTQPVAVGLAGDDLAELSETFVVRLSNPTGGATLAAGKGQATATIEDDDGTPAKVSVANSGPGAEGGTAQFSVTLERAVPEPVTVSYTIRDEGTARAGEDYQLRAGTVEFAPNETSKQIAVPIQADSRDEVDETFTLVLSNPIDAEIGTGTATGSITDDDEPPVISMDTLDLEEGNESPSSGDVVVRLTPASGQTVTVAYAIGPDGDADPENDAVAGQDYQAEANGVITFPAGADRRRISVDALPDGLDELPERFLIALSGPTNATLGTTPDALVTIEDGDASPIVSISAPDPVVEPKDNREVQTIFSLTLSAVSGLPVFITYATTDGSARDADGDYMGGGPVTQIISPGRLGAPISIPVKGDGLTDDEPIEDFSVTISGPDNARLPVEAGGATATAVILDVDGEPTLSVFDSRVPEGDGAESVRPLIRLVPPAPTDVTVQLATADDSAGAPDDYAGVDGATVAFAAGRTVPNADSVVSVAVVGDLDDEETEQFEVILSPGTAATVPAARETAVVSIVDDDGPDVSVGDVSVTEGDGATTGITFEVTLSEPSAEPVSVDYATAAGTATAVDDFESLQARTLDFGPGETAGTVTVEVVGDLADEADETFTLGLSNAVNADIGRSLGVATILDNDQPVLVVSAAAGSTDLPSVFETDLDAASVVFTLALQSPAGFVATRESSVAYATTNTRAVAGGDFLPASGRVTFAPGETIKTVVVSVIGDSLDEPDETVNLAVTDPVNLTLPGQALGTILDDDEPGYVLVATDGGMFTFGAADFAGSTGSVKLNQPIVGMAAHPSGRGYWLVAADGGIFTFGEAGFYGSTGAIKLNRPIVGMAPTPSGKGYWLVATDGGIFAFGDAAFQGSTGAIKLNKPVVGMAPTPSGKGYWLVATDGGIFAFGDAKFQGSTAAITLNQPIVGMASTSGGQGYWLVATDGGIFAFGDAVFHGSTGSVKLNRPIVGMAPTPSGNGYWLVADDGGIFTFGDADFLGSTGNIKLNKPVVGMAVL